MIRHEKSISRIIRNKEKPCSCHIKPISPRPFQKPKIRYRFVTLEKSRVDPKNGMISNYTQFRDRFHSEPEYFDQKKVH